MGRGAHVRRPSRWKVLVDFLLAAAAVGWLVFLRPPVLGGSVTYVVVSGNSMEPTLRPGDLVLTAQATSYRPGDVVAFRIPQREPGAGSLVIHRIVGGSDSAGFVLQGDNKPSPDLWRPAARDVAGRTWVHLPAIGAAVAAIRSPLVLATAAGILTVLVVLLPQPRAGSGTARRGRHTPDEGVLGPWVSGHVVALRETAPDGRPGRRS